MTTLTAPRRADDTDAQDHAALLDALRDAIGPAHVVTDAKDFDARLIEDRGLRRGTALALIRPGSTEEVAACMRLCHGAQVPVTPQGGNTGLAGGGVPDGGIILTTDRLNRIRAVDPTNATMTVEAGCILANIQAAADEVDALFPLSLASEGSCQIGGNLSTNAGGTAVLRYGNTRDLVLGIEAVLPDGRVLNDLNGLRKNNTGFDLKHLFIGAEGTLGIITAAVIKLFPKPTARATALVACTGPDPALALYARMRGQTADTLSTFEYIDRLGLQMVIDHAPGCSDPMAEVHPAYCLIELTGNGAQTNLDARLETALEAAFEAEEIIDAVIGASEAQKMRFGRCARTCQRRRNPKARRSNMTFRSRCPAWRISSARQPKPVWITCPGCAPAPLAISATATCISTCRARWIWRMRRSLPNTGPSTESCMISCTRWAALSRRNMASAPSNAPSCAGIKTRLRWS